MNRVRMLLASLVIIACARVAPAQTTKNAGPEVHKLTVRPAAPGVPPLRYRLTPPHNDTTPGDAAPVYMAAMLVLANQPQAWHEQVERLQAMPIDQLPRDEVRTLLAEARPMLDQLHVAARREYCHWDLPRREHAATSLLPHLHRMRPVVRLLSLNTRLAALEGRYDDAATSMQTSLALVRHCQDDDAGVLIDALVASMVGQLFMEDVAAVMSRDDGPNLYWALATVPRPLLDAPAIVRRERGFFYFVFPQLRDPRKSNLTDAQWQQTLIDILRELSTEPPSKPELEKLQQRVAQLNAALLPKARGMAGMDGASDAQAIATYAVAEMERWRDEREKWFDLPFWQGYRGLLETDRAIREMQAKEVNPNPLVTMEPKTASWFARLIGPDRKAAALQTIEVIRAHGKVPAKLTDVTALPLPIDPTTGQPFLYEARDGGFTLISRVEGGEPSDELRYEVTLK
jgi:hypothetical protein